MSMIESKIQIQDRISRFILKDSYCKKLSMKELVQFDIILKNEILSVLIDLRDLKVEESKIQIDKKLRI